MLHTVLLDILLAVMIYMSVWYLLSIILKDSSIADIAWGLGFILVAAVALYRSGSINTTKIVVSALVTVWALRLSGYIFLRNRGKKEDFRYRKWREEWDYFYLRSYLQVFILQGLLMILFSLPVIWINLYAGPGFGWIAGVGVAVWGIGFFFEAVGDWQKHRFLQSNQKGLLTSGLWKYTRHPNYFGEATMWWGLGLIAATVLNGWWTLIGPAALTFFLLEISGVPMLEKKLSELDGWDEYAAKTNVFVPWFPDEDD